MRKVFLFLSGLILIAAMCGGMFLAAAIYDTAGKTTVVPYFFQPDDEFHRRPGVPASPEDLGMNVEDFENSRMYNLLMSRVIMEMFYVTPDSDEMQRRLDGDTGLVNMVTPDVFKIWQKEIAPELQQMVTDKKLRMVRIVQIDTEDQYKKVTYELKTWNKPNDMNTLPEQCGIWDTMSVRQRFGIFWKRTASFLIPNGDYAETGLNSSKRSSM